MKIHALMIPDPITVSVNTSISEAIELMKINSIRHLPVVSAGNHLEGFLTLADLKQGLPARRPGHRSRQGGPLPLLNLPSLPGGRT